MAEPKIRFPKFVDDWEQYKIGEVGSFYYGRSCPKWSVTENATIPCVRYGELYTKFGSKIDKVYSYTNIQADKLRFSKGTEVLIPRVGEDPMDYNHCTWLSIPNVAIGEMISVYNTKQNPLFTAMMFNATLRNEFAIRVEGFSVTNLYFEELKNITVYYPCLEEQQKIADFLSTVDEVIAQSEAEVRNLEQQKKAAMQKIFSQEVRFKREDGTEYPEWEEYSIAEIVSKVFDIDHYMPDSVENGIPYVMTADLVEHSEIDFDNCKKVSYEDYCKLSKKGKTEKGDIIFARYATIGTVKLVKTDRVFLVSYSCVTIKELSNKLTNRFLYQYFCSSLFAKKIKTQINTGTQGNIGIDILKQHRLLLPHIEEQQKIADFLSAYDEAISYAKQELDKWKELKKGLLQQMFV